MRAGGLRHSIKIVKPGRTADGYGGATIADIVHVEVLAGIEQLSAREQFFGQQNYPTATHRIRTHFIESLQQNMEIVFGSRRFKILAIDNPKEIGRDSVIVAEEAPA